MKHKDIARMLKAAGMIALTGILAVFYIYIPVRTAVGGVLPGAWGCIAALALLGLPYLPAIVNYFSICGRIACDRSFCIENVRSMQRIARLMIVSTVLWCIAALILFILPESSSIYAALGSIAGISHVFAKAVPLLAAAAGLAVALVAKMLSLLLNRAAELQADSELTI